MGLDMRGAGKMISKTGLGSSLGRMDPVMRVISFKEKSMEKVSSEIL